MPKIKSKDRRFIVLAVLLLALIGGAYYFSSKATPPAPQQLTLRGTVRLGEQLGIDHCKEGVYLDVADDNPFPLIQLRDADGKTFGNDFLLQYMNKNVEVAALYDANKVQCQALICACDDYVLLQEIRIV